MEVRRYWVLTFKILRGKYFQPRILYPAELSVRYERRINIFRQIRCHKFTSQGHFIWKLLDDVVDQNEAVKQERGRRSKIQTDGDPTQKNQERR